MTSARHAVERYLEAINAHDTDTALGCLAANFELRFSGSDYVMSREAAASAVGWDVGANGRLSWKVVSADENQVTIEGSETNDFLQLIGIGDLKFRSTYGVSPDGMIESQKHEVDWGILSLDAAMKPLIAWAAETAPAELEQIFPDGRMVHDAATARRWVTLARRWQLGTSS